MTVEYPYAKGDLLDKPNTYAYSPYSGEAFLDTWRHSRQSALDSLPPPAIQSAGDGCSDGDDTLAYLGAVCRHLRERDADASADLDPLVRSFEIHKRIYRRYTERWRPAHETDFRDPAPYLRFAEALDLAYEATGGLPYLNALLKCLDTLTAIRGTLADGDGGRLARLIVQEREYIDALDADVRGRT